MRKKNSISFFPSKLHLEEIENLWSWNYQSKSWLLRYREKFILFFYKSSGLWKLFSSSCFVIEMLEMKFVNFLSSLSSSLISKHLNIQPLSLLIVEQTNFFQLSSNVDEERRWRQSQKVLNNLLNYSSSGLAPLIVDKLNIVFQFQSITPEKYATAEYVERMLLYNWWVS